MAREPRRCKLGLNNRIIEQIFEFTRLDIMISPYGNLKPSIRHQMKKAARISAALCESKLTQLKPEKERHAQTGMRVLEAITR
ncbi:hypothetical protein QE152_g30146 [Popillia japonica]|uniref:Uncharacterized protein n=1 Tax=Popillia japonica TaxID=7064 RepID=A0AAW1JFM1_POPJA